MSDRKPLTITDEDFETLVLKAGGIAVVDFWSPRCGPCHQMAPALEAFYETNEGRARVFKLDVDDNPKMTERYEVRSVPTIMYFKDGKQEITYNGAMSQSALQEKLDLLLQP
jgi:thioredoxin 1